ncbi:MAG: DUF5688 family protein [Lachnospiraceae bacterium]|nr:DUF5688 family protein [Lachnospiraceae bacterium]
MDYTEFKDQIIEDLKERFAEHGTDMDISINTVEKLNQSYEAITVKPVGESIGVNMPVSKFYDQLEDGKDYSDIVDKMVDVIEKGLENKPDIDTGTLTDYSQMKDKLAMEVVSSKTNAEMLDKIPHENIEDMAVVYRFILQSDEEGRASILVTNQMMDTMGITHDQLRQDALENAPKIKPLVISGMSEVMMELVGVEQAEMMGIVPVDPKDEQMFVATVPDKVHGAGVLAYNDFLEQAAERAGGDFFIIPSSIHELLIVPDNGQMDLSSLESMVKEVNATQVAPEDKLTDSVYHYDSKEKIFELGEKFVERQALQNAREEYDSDKEMRDSLDEKSSVLGDLEAKKEETARAPKKETVDRGTKSKGGEAI